MERSRPVHPTTCSGRPRSPRKWSRDFGMSETLGPRTYARPPQPFLTGTTADRVVASEATEREIDIAVRDIVVKAFDRATEVLRKRRADLDEGPRLLLVRETVTADQLPAIRSAG